MRIIVKNFEVVSATNCKILPCGADLADGGAMGKKWAFVVHEDRLEAHTIFWGDGYHELHLMDEIDIDESGDGEFGLVGCNLIEITCEKK